MFGGKSIRTFIEWAHPSLKKLKITSISIELSRVLDVVVPIDLPYYYNKKFYNVVELEENEEIEMLFCINFEDGISICSVDAVFKDNKYEVKPFVLGHFSGKRFTFSCENPNSAEEVRKWVKKTEEAVKTTIALLNDYMKK